MRRRFVGHPRRYAGDRPVGLRNNNQFSTTVGILPGNEHGLAAPGMKRIVNPPFDWVLVGSMSLLRERIEIGLDKRGGSFETAAVQPPQDEEFLNAIKGLPHPEEPPQAASRR